jgi:hypothetical protein
MIENVDVPLRGLDEISVVHPGRAALSPVAMIR